MLNVPIAFLKAPGIGFDVMRLTPDLKTLFRSTNVNLQISDATDLGVSFPERNWRYTGAVQLLHNWGSRKRRKPGFVLFDHTWAPGVSTSYNGLMPDPTRRSLAVVMTKSSVVRTRSAKGLLQVAAHEIGHMLNLGHRDRRELTIGGQDYSYSSTMDQAGLRQSDPELAWRTAFAEARALATTLGRPTYFSSQNAATHGYPFSWFSRRKLHRPAQKVLPWGDPHDTAAMHADFEGHHAIDVTLAADNDRCMVGEGLAVTVTVTSLQDELTLPHNLDPEFGSVLLHVQPPRGQSYVVPPRVVGSPGRSVTLRAGEQHSGQCFLYAAHDDAIFSHPGRYRLKVIVLDAGTSSNEIEIVVAPSFISALRQKPFRRFICNGMPPTWSRATRAFDEVIRDKTAPASLCKHLQLMRARGNSNPETALEAIQKAAAYTLSSVETNVVTLFHGELVASSRGSRETLEKLIDGARIDETTTHALGVLIENLERENHDEEELVL